MVGKDSTRQAAANKAGGKITDHMQRKSPQNDKSKTNNNKKDINANSPVNTAHDTTAADTKGLEEIMRLLRNLTSDVQEIKRDYNGIKESMDRSIMASEECQAKMLQLEAENDLLKERISKLERKSEVREREEKRNSVIIRGLEVQESDVQAAVKDLLATELYISGDIKEIKPFVKAGKVNFIIVKFESAEVKKKLMINKKKLAGSSISINHDMTLEEREVQRKILKIAREKEDQGAKVKIGYRKLWINENLYIWKVGTGLVEKFRRESGTHTQSTQVSRISQQYWERRPRQQETQEQ